MLIRASFIAPFLRTTKLQGSFQKKASSLSSRKRCKSFVPLCCTSGQNDTPSVPLFEMRNVTFQIPFNFDVVLFRDMRFHINPGEFIIMIGSNGAGKSTAIRIMLGLERVKKAQFFWNGEPVRPKQILRRCGVVLQNPSQYFLTRRVLDELTLGHNDRQPEDVRRILIQIGLSDISLMAHPKSLSGGQIRRLAVADQLLKSPPPQLLILDEPLSGVDWTARGDLVHFLGSLKRQFAILLVTHEPGDLLPYADRVVEVSNQKINTIDPNIINRAIGTRARLKAERRARAIEEARLYKVHMKEDGVS